MIQIRALPCLRRSLALAALTLGSSAACTPDFDEVWLVKDLRVLALRATPPEVFHLDPSSPPPTVQLDALVVDPTLPEGAALDWELWACTPEDDTCQNTQQRWLLHQDSTPLAAISYELVPTPEMLQAAQAADPLKGFGGLPLVVELRVRRDAQEARASKRVVYSAPMPEGRQPNQNPALARLLANEEPAGEQLLLDQPVEVTLLPEPTDKSEESYLVPTFGGQARALTEYLSYAFFTTAGELSQRITGGRPSPFAEIKRVTDLRSVWTPDPEVAQTTLWVVIRDDRGGASWVTLPATIGP